MPRTRFEESAEDEALRVEIGGRLRELRVASGLSLAKLAARLGGRDSNNLARVERGEQWPSVPHVVALCREFEASADYVLLGQGGPPVPQAQTRKPFELLATPAQHEPKKEPTKVPTRLPPAVAAFLVREGSKLAPELVEMLRHTDYAALGLSDITPDEVRKFVAALDFTPESDDD